MKIFISGIVLLLLLAMALGLAYVFDAITYKEFIDLGGKTAIAVGILILGGLLARLILKASSSAQSSGGDSQKNQGPHF